jgi:lambda family phage portal protein
MTMFDQMKRIFRIGPVLPWPAPPARPVQNRAAYEAGSAGGRRTVNWTVPDVSANLATCGAKLIRDRCRDAVRNDAWARAIVETFVDDVIGWGIKPLSRAQDEAFRQVLQALWESWCAVADADGVLDFAGLQSLALRSMLVDGECFIRLRRRLPIDGLPVPLQLQVLPAEICPAEYTTPAADGAEVKQGIEYSAIGKRLAYHLREAPPGEDDIAHSSGVTHRVPAEQVLHLFEPLRPGQRRGVSALAPALVRLQELDKYADATLLRLQLSAMFVGIVKPGLQAGPTNYDPLTGEALSETATTRPALQLAPGTFQELYPGEDLTFPKPPDPPVGFADFVAHELRAAGAAVGVPLECFTHDWGATNDRLARVVLNQYRRRVHRLLWSIVVPQFLRPVWNVWFAAARAAGALPVGVNYLEDRDGKVTFAPHAHAYVHPVQDVVSYKEAIRSGLTSRAAAVSETGEDVEVIDAQIAADQTRADKLGLKLDTDGRQQKGAAQ